MTHSNLDASDRRILEQLQKDGRLTNLELAARVGLSPSPCLRRVRALEEHGYIDGYTVRLNRQQLGLNVMAFVLVKIERHAQIDMPGMRDAILALPEVLACYVTSGDFDLLLRVIVQDLGAYRDFALDRLLGIQGIRDITTSFVIDSVTDDRPLPLNHIR
jgi:Lrp/AsnC family transcriptional regulator, leucine-responsive regulatory protein